MKLCFLYQPVPDLDSAAAFYVATLGWEQAWREESSVAFWIPDRSAKVMLSVSGKPAGPMYLVDNLDEWAGEHPDAVVAVEKDRAGAGSVIGFEGPAGGIFYVFDQPDTDVRSSESAAEPRRQSSVVGAADRQTDDQDLRRCDDPT